ncbi:MAG TPA: FAD-dependent oxidoreductase [Stellaceae bacterium]|jgi:glycine/D-amino acid oxidase-like deaminating enzyme|nr:FAD-dependent oxidoreductase [Stellaceae bacterium]
MHVLICGGGAIGCSIAYFLSRRGVKATVVESTGIACAASGKSGGFLARDWCQGTPLDPLARRSFDLHAQLAAEIADDLGYRRLDTYGGFASRRVSLGQHRGAYSLDWFAGDVAVSQVIGSPETTAQVHPARYTEAMMRAAEAHGAELKQGRVTGLMRDGDRVTGVELEDGATIAADAVVIAMGPWSVLAARWLKLPPVFGLKGHSLVFDTGDRVPAEAAFLEYQEETGAVLTPELFPRPDGTTYVCGISGEDVVPLDPARVKPDGGAIYRLEAMCRALSPVLAAAPILARQACYRPVTGDGLPLIGKAADAGGAYIATGHSVWGILNAPATGEAMAELIADGAARTVDLAPFDPGRLRPLDPARLRVN